MKIRRLDARDALQYKNLRLEGVLDTPTSFALNSAEVLATSLEELGEQLTANAQRVVFGAFDGEELIGMAGVFREPLEKLKHKAGIRTVYTTPSRRGQGVARRLLEASVAESRANPEVRVVTLSVNTENLPAKALYQSLGFVAYGVQRKSMLVDGVYVDEEQMMLELA
ncbi:MAG TPA: N-acetyltransferase [Janthinobacterium sp.]|nr:N-acetyltransferase [Janthinobacterium sp.]